MYPHFGTENFSETRETMRQSFYKAFLQLERFSAQNVVNSMAYSEKIGRMKEGKKFIQQVR
jgi:hypothetical protein